jgi:hypothetical protein
MARYAEGATIETIYAELVEREAVAANPDG